MPTTPKRNEPVLTSGRLDVPSMAGRSGLSGLEQHGSTPHHHASRKRAATFTTSPACRHPAAIKSPSRRDIPQATANRCATWAVTLARLMRRRYVKYLDHRRFVLSMNKQFVTCFLQMVLRHRDSHHLLSPHPHR